MSGVAGAGCACVQSVDKHGRLPWFRYVKWSQNTLMSDVIPGKYADLLASTALAHVATIGLDGEPQTSPVWCGWDGTFLRFAQGRGTSRRSGTSDASRASPARSSTR